MNNLLYDTASRQHVLGLRCAPIPLLRVAFIGLGARGIKALERFMHLPGTEVTVLCEPQTASIQAAQTLLQQYEKRPPKTYSKEDDWKRACELPEVDLVYVCTQWELHVPIALHAMQAGKHVALEVPAALTVADCWALVDMAERTRRHCTMLENTLYDRFELATYQMALTGLFGEVVHGEGAYIHDLRSLYFQEGERGQWRQTLHERYNGNPYPTHGLGPICRIMGIHAGDRLQQLVSMSSGSFGLQAYAQAQFGADSPQACHPYTAADINHTLIRTARGRTILLQHDVISPRPYSRHHLVSGTRGFAQRWPQPCIALEPDAHIPLPESEMESLIDAHIPAFFRKAYALAPAGDARGPMSFAMDYRLVHCLRNGLPLDSSVYDAAAWSCIVELSSRSAMEGSRPVEIPDFTRGAWQ